MATLQAVIRRTYDAQSSELLLIQAKQDIEQPQPTILVDELGE
jgi:pyridoxal/pyridoxine/pyridoxamine kinase